MCIHNRNTVTFPLYAKTRPLTQAERILKKFGGARRLAEILTLTGKMKTPSTIYRWTYSREKGGTGGLVPTSAWPDILVAARYAGIVLEDDLISPATFVPRKRFRYDTEMEE